MIPAERIRKVEKAAVLMQEAQQIMLEVFPTASEQDRHHWGLYVQAYASLQTAKNLTHLTAARLKAVPAAGSRGGRGDETRSD